MKTLLELVSEIKSDPRTQNLTIQIIETNNGFHRPEDISFYAMWKRTPVRLACSHYEDRSTMSYTSDISPEDALQKMHLLHELTDEQLADERIVTSVLYHDGDVAAYDLIYRVSAE